MAHLHVFPGWTQDDSYRIRRSGRTERGVRAYSPAWSELPTRNWVSGVEWDKRGHNSGMTPVNRKAGTGERTREPPGGNAWYLYSPVGFRHHWFERQISWCLSGGRSLWKNAPAGPGLFALVLSFRYAYRYVICLSSLRSPQTHDRTEWANERGSGKPSERTVSTFAPGPSWTNNKRLPLTWLNSSRISPCFFWTGLMSWIWIMRLISARNSMRMRNAFTEACQRAWMSSRTVRNVSVLGITGVIPASP